MNLILIGVILYLPLNGVHGLPCDNGWLAFEGKCYLKYSTRLTWKSAFLTCPGNYVPTQLVTVDSEEVNTFLRTNVTHDETFWIGLGFGRRYLTPTLYWHFNINKYNWTWSDSAHITYSDWIDGNVTSGCVVMTHKQRWYTQSCRFYRNFVCEKDLVNDNCGTWQVHENHCYLFVDALKSNCMNAARFCWNEEAYLLSINNQQEAQFVYETLVNNTEYWIGLSPFSWADGTPYQWNNWDDNGPSIDKKCTLINISTGKWSSENCDYEYPDRNRFICQRDIIETTTYPSESSIESHTMSHDFSTITLSDNIQRQEDGASVLTNTKTDVYIAIIATLVIIVIGLVIGMTGVCVYFKRRLIPKTRTQEEPTIYYNEVQKENAHTTVERYELSNTAIKNPDTIPEDKQTNTYEHLSQDPYANSKTITDGPYASLE